MSSSTSKATPAATSMAELMARNTQAKLLSFKKGDNVKGKLIKMDRREILVDIQAKGQAIVLERDPRMLRNIHANLKLGQEVEVTVLSPESDSGQPIVSLRKFIDGIVWRHLEEMKKSQEKVDVTINEVTKGGFVVSTKDGLNGFLPNSHTNSSQGPISQGKIINVSIADLNREDNKIIFSQKTSMTPEEFGKMVAAFKRDTKVTGEVSSVTNFGYFVLLHTADSTRPVDGLIHISEISWQKSDDLLTLLKVGDSVEAIVIGIDRDARRVDLSLKRLSTDPFEKVKEEFTLEKRVAGKIVRIEDGNLILDLGEGVEGLIKKEKVPPTATYDVGQMVNATVTAHDTRRRRLELVPVLLEKPLTYR